jgi:hypothetical protein
MIGNCRDVKAGKTFTKADKDRNTHISKERYTSKNQAHIAQSDSTSPSSDFAFMAHYTSLSIPQAPG